ncbi:glycosyltransferase family 2 protein [Chryseobacterium cucumeris]|uniref:glycosyltransferase family 2 protein n=1 Tax=Chryseobacterium cucumeris TaxID=1813611 RepID=UPI0023F02DD2|nr:glycosyltransferase [Chryseobacterium cucumeris]
MEKISILIANYNNGEYFKECFTSLINQTYSNWEAIIVDDCSVDDSVNIIKKIIENDSRFLLFQNPENKGCGFTKRKCMEFATGVICAYLDPDDALYPEAIEKAIQGYTNNNIVATYSKMMLCDENLIPHKVFSKTKNIYNNKYFFNYPIQFAHFFTFRKCVYFKTTGINPTLKTAVDQDLYLKILELGQVKFIRKVLYKYRLHSNGISQQDTKEVAKESFASVIYATMKRRGIKKINKQLIPNTYKNPEDIFKLLDYQLHPVYRLIMKINLVLLQIFPKLYFKTNKSASE